MRWFVGVLVLLFVALVLRSGLLAFATYTLLGLLLLSRVTARERASNLQATRVMRRVAGRGENEEPEDPQPAATIHAEVGDRVQVLVTLRYGGWMPVPWVLIEDLLPLSAMRKDARIRVAKGKHIQVRMLRAGKEAVLRYQVECVRRGYFQIGPLVIESGDLFGLHRRYRVETEPGYVLVYPRIVPLIGYELASRRPIGDVRITHRLFEDPTRIAGVRPYEPGDPPNRVHWKATARVGSLQSKVHEPSSLSGATVVLDFHRSGYHERGEPIRSELAVTTALSLANAVFEVGQQVGLLTNGRDAAERLRTQWQREAGNRESARTAAMSEDNTQLRPLQIETRRGVEQVQRIRELLARVELTDGLPFPRLIEESTGRVPRDATVIAVLAEVPAETAITLGTLRRQGFAVTVVLVVFEIADLERAQARLYAEGVRDIRHVRNEAELTEVCMRQVGYAGVVESM